MESLKVLLREAYEGMKVLSTFVQRQKKPHVHLVAVSRNQESLMVRIEAALQASDSSVAWLSEEAGTFKARLGDLEMFIYRDAGEWVWSLQTVEGRGAKTLREAQDDITRAAKAAHLGRDRRHGT